MHKRLCPALFSPALWLFASVLVATFTFQVARADPGFPLRRVPICGDQDGSEQPLIGRCQEFVHFPDAQVYRVPGSGTFDFSADFVYREARYNNELGFFVVDDEAGTVEGFQPGSSGYLRAALDRATIIFPSGSHAGTADFHKQIAAGQILVFFIIQNNTLENFRSTNPDNDIDRRPLAFFSLDELNPDNVDHFVGFKHLELGITQFGFEDQTAGGDRDYDDVVYNVISPVAARPERGILSLPFPHSEDDNGLGHVWSFFDHEYPIYKAEPVSASSTILPFTGKPEFGLVDNCSEGVSCYSGHDGTDFTIGITASTPVLAAADGTVSWGHDSCSGNFVRVDHGEFQTFYGHLTDDQYWRKDGIVKAGERIGTAGNTGTCTTGVHIHFGVYADEDEDGVFEGDEVVDPYGWQGGCSISTTDPWTLEFTDRFGRTRKGAPSDWLWEFSPSACVQISPGVGYAFTTADGTVVTVVEGAIAERVNIGYSIAPDPSTTTYSAGQTSGSASEATNTVTIPVGPVFQLSAHSESGPLASFNKPIDITIPFTEDQLVHVDQNTLSVYRWDVSNHVWRVLATEMDVENMRLAASSKKAGFFSIRGRPIQPTPEIHGVTPQQIGNLAPTVLIVRGSNFVEGASAALGEGGLAVQYNSATEISVTVPVNVTAGTYELIVQNSDGQRAVLQEAVTVIGFTYLPSVLRE